MICMKEYSQQGGARRSYKQYSLPVFQAWRVHTFSSQYGDFILNIPEHGRIESLMSVFV